MKIIASSVIRSAVRGQSHGGLYVVDSNKQIMEQVLDWTYPHIRWDLEDNGGGDRGMRGMVFYKDHLYAAGSMYIYKFNKKFELVNKFDNEYFNGTHEMFSTGNILYSIANSFDAIWRFDLDKEEWIDGFYHTLGQSPKIFQPGEKIPHGDSLHLDSISVKDGMVWYAGSTTEYLYGFNPEILEQKQIKLYHKNTHNAQFWQQGIVFNRALESETCYQVEDDLIWTWKTPRMDRSQIINMIPGDHARAEYTRGMAIDGETIAVGTSPASVHFFNLGSTEPILSAVLSTDIRNSVCGLALYPWEI